IKGKIDKLFTSPVVDLEYKYREFPGRIENGEFLINGNPSLAGKIRTKNNRLNIGIHLDLTESSISYKDIYKKSLSEKLTLQGGLFYNKGNIDISWYLLELPGASLSGTGSILNTGETIINIIGEEIDLNKLRNNFSFIKKYVTGGTMNTRSTFNYSGDGPDMDIYFDVDNMSIMNFPGLTKLYEKLADKTKKRFDINNTTAKLKLTKEKLQLDNIELTGDDLEGTGKGYYIWGEEVNFVFYPRIEDRKIGLRVYGSTDNIKVGLK
ncbi:MAG: hypothetical protein PF545_06625, partial [Elusimicrobia bacterium]|nr:hypothetical protein [Elusimicrobiota bacterium]